MTSERLLHTHHQTHITMQAANALSIQFEQKLNALQDQLHTIGGLLQQNNIGNADLSIEPSLKNVQDQQVESLKQKWINLKYPSFSFDQFSSYCNLVLRESHIREINRNLDKARASYSEELQRRGPSLLAFQEENLAFLSHEDFSGISGNPALNREQSLPFTPHHLVTFTDGVAIALNPATLIPFDRPLQYNREVTLDFLTNYDLVFYPLTEIPNLMRCYENILTKGEKFGMRRTQISILLKEFIKKYHSSYYFSVANETNPDNIFNICLQLITAQDPAAQLTTLLNNLKRPHGSDITEIFWKHKTLLLSKLSIREPALTASGLESKTNRLASQALRNFVSPLLLPHLDAYINSRHRDGKDLAPKVLISFIQNLEKRDPTLRPTGDIYFASPEFSAEINMANTRQQTKGQPNYQFQSSPQDRKPRRDKGYHKSRNQNRQAKASRRPSYRSPSPASTTRGPSPARPSPAPVPRRSLSRDRQGSRDSSRQQSKSPHRAASPSPPNVHSRMSSRSRERFKNKLNKEMESLNRKLRNAKIDSCSKCGKSNHKSRDCRTFPYFSDKKCHICNLFHKASDCPKRKNFWSAKN